MAIRFIHNIPADKVDQQIRIQKAAGATKVELSGDRPFPGSAPPVRGHDPVSQADERNQRDRPFRPHSRAGLWVDRIHFIQHHAESITHLDDGSRNSGPARTSEHQTDRIFLTADR